MADPVLITTRWGLYVVLGLLAGLPLVQALLCRAPRRWLGPALAVLALAGIGLTLLWLAASAAQMAGTALTSPDWETMKLIVTATAFGKPLLARLAALGALFLLVLPGPRLAARGRGGLAVLSLLAGGAAVTLAWTGHAAALDGDTGRWLLAADMLHLIAAAAWLGGLAHLLLAALAPVRGAAGLADLHRELHRFSIVGTLIVLALIPTGVTNLVLIAGADLRAILGQPWGQLLAIKLLLFAGMLGLAALNRWLLTPRLLRASAANVPGALRLSLAVETLLWLALAALVARLGTLDPGGIV